jgi:hypothetical protein
MKAERRLRQGARREKSVAVTLWAQSPNVGFVISLAFTHGSSTALRSENRDTRRSGRIETGVFSGRPKVSRPSYPTARPGVIQTVTEFNPAQVEG